MNNHNLFYVYMKLWTRLGKARQLEGGGGRASCLTSAGRVALAGGTTFPHANSLSRSLET